MSTSRRRVAASAGHPNGGRITVALAAFTAVYCVLQVASYTGKSATWDEPVHLATGYAALAGDYRVEATHPPLMRMWAALPLRFMRGIHLDTGVIDRTPPAAWHSDSTAYDFATKFLYVDNDADRLLNAARFMIVLCGLALGILIFCWTYEWLGFAPAVCTLVFYSLSPNLLANTSLVTTDAGITCFMFATVYWLWRTCRRYSAANLTGLVVSFAAAIVTKFSGLILAPLVSLLLLLAIVHRTEITWRRAVTIVALLAVGTYAAVWAVYGFRYLPSPSPSWALHLEQASLARTVPHVAQVTAWIDGHRLLPNLFTEGFLMFVQSLAPPNYTFLAGAYSSEGWWYYFPVAFLIKTPLAFVVLIAIGLVVSQRMRRVLGGLNEAFVLLPVVVYLAPAIASTYQVGIRHILPLYPFLLMIAAVAAMPMLRRPALRLTLAALSISWAIAVAAVYPYTLTFFSRVVGGPRQGYRYLADSNVDWGQGLKQLKAWMAGRGISRIALAYFGSADPAYYGIDYTALPAATPGFELPSVARRWSRPQLPGYVAVSATVLSGAYLDPQWRLFYRGLQQRQPVAVIANSIFVYWLDRWPEPEMPGAGDEQPERVLADELLNAQWFSRAALHYRRYLARHPDDPRALLNLGVALASAGSVDEGIVALRRGVTLAPEIGLGHVALANALAVRGQFAEAATVVNQALAIDPADAAARDLLRQIQAARDARYSSGAGTAARPLRTSAAAGSRVPFASGVPHWPRTATRREGSVAAR